MKYIVILCDGMADDLLEELDGRSPLEAAHTPNMDRLAKPLRSVWPARSRKAWRRAATLPIFQ